MGGGEDGCLGVLGLGLLVGMVGLGVGIEIGTWGARNDGLNEASAAIAPVAGIEVDRVGDAWVVDGGGRRGIGETIQAAVDDWQGKAAVEAEGEDE